MRWQRPLLVARYQSHRDAALRHFVDQWKTGPTRQFDIEQRNIYPLACKPATDREPRYRSNYVGPEPV